jgi:hypothetical protein
VILHVSLKFRVQIHLVDVGLPTARSTLDADALGEWVERELGETAVAAHDELGHEQRQHVRQRFDRVLARYVRAFALRLLWIKRRLCANVLREEMRQVFDTGGSASTAQNTHAALTVCRHVKISSHFVDVDEVRANHFAASDDLNVQLMSLVTIERIVDRRINWQAFRLLCHFANINATFSHFDLSVSTGD